MDRSPSPTLTTHCAALPDPWTGPAIRHQLLDLVTIALCAVLCGTDSWVDVALFGRSKEAWFRTFLALPHGIPAHDTSGRVFAALDAAAFEQCFLGWVQRVARATQGEIIAIDGKTVRRSHDHVAGRGPIDLVSGWARQQHVVLGQVATDAKSNEITAIPAFFTVPV